MNTVAVKSSIPFIKGSWSPIILSKRTLEFQRALVPDGDTGRSWTPLFHGHTKSMPTYGTIPPEEEKTPRFQKCNYPIIGINYLNNLSYPYLPCQKKSLIIEEIHSFGLISTSKYQIIVKLFICILSFVYRSNVQFFNVKIVPLPKLYSQTFCPSLQHLHSRYSESTILSHQVNNAYVSLTASSFKLQYFISNQLLSSPTSSCLTITAYELSLSDKFIM